jgi:predicted RNase H-like HicB family nuclease
MQRPFGPKHPWESGWMEDPIQTILRKSKVAEFVTESPEAESIDHAGLLITARVAVALRINLLESQVGELTTRLEEVEAILERGEPQSIIVPISTFAPEPYELLNEIRVVVESSGDGFIASFYDANVSTSGESREEAVANLKELILDTFDLLSEGTEETLGPLPRRQKRVLECLMRRIQ